MNELETSDKHDALPADFVQRINDLPTSATVCIRKRFRPPEGWVIIAETVLHEVPEAWPNGWIIKRPGQYETVHDHSPIPNGYVKTWRVSSPMGCGPGPNAWQIQRLATARGQ